MGTWDDIFGGGGEAERRNREQREMLNQQVTASGGFADQAQANYGRTGAEAEAARGYLRDLAMGKNSVSAEQLRQGLQQNLAAQQAMAAGARPANAAMAARTAAIQSGRLGAGLAGQQAIAGLQERQAAQKALNDAILQARQQDTTAALGARGAAIQGIGSQPKEEREPGFFQTTLLPTAAAALPFFAGGGGGATRSDRRAKHDIEDADDDTRKIVDGLKAYRFKYKDDKDGKGSQYGVMAQDLERAGLGHAVINTRSGKYVDGGKLSTSNTAMIASLGKRIAQLEGKK
jgi:hypothetical protein